MKREDILFPKFSEKFFRMDFESEPLPVLSLYPFPPPITLEQVRLEVSGLEEPSRVIAWSALSDIPRVKIESAIICQIFNWSETVAWEGIRLVDFLDYFKIDTHPEGYFAFYSRDKIFFEGLSRDEARDPRVFLAYGLNGAPLPEQHGGPLRLVVPFLQGYKSVKWVHAIRGYRNDPIGIKRLLGQAPTGILNKKWKEKYQIVPPAGKAGDPLLFAPLVEKSVGASLVGAQNIESTATVIEDAESCVLIPPVSAKFSMLPSKEKDTSSKTLKEIIVLIRPHKHIETRKELEKVGVFSYTTQSVLGRSKQRGLKLSADGHNSVAIKFLPKRYFSIVVTEKKLSLAISAIVKANRSGIGKMGDGRIFVIDLEEVVRISTDEHGGEAV
ncbi:MAG: molybdopterin-dependent oxidoreductase [Nitrospirota bacterium]